MPRVYLYNTSIITAYGSYRYEPLSFHEARTIALTNSAESAIGHQATADILTELFGFKVEVNRSNNQQQVGELGIVFKLRGRPEEGKVLNREEVEAIGYDFGLLTRTA
jgi:viroplasmin and RNaseH domain-containing protein